MMLTKELAKEAIAPIFELKDIFGRTINLAGYKDKKVLLCFFRHAGCPFCNLRVHSLSKIHRDLQNKGLEMIFFFESKESIILRSSFHTGISPIPIISDPQKVWYGNYGLESSALKAGMSIFTTFVQTSLKAKALSLPNHLMADGESVKTMPAEFLLDRGLVVKHAYYSGSLNDRMDLNIIKEFAEENSLVLQ